MLITKQSLRDGWIWIASSLLLLAGLWLAYPAAARRIGGSSGGSVYGLTAGIIGTLIIVFAMALIVRKTWRTLRVGRTYQWLQGHVWLGLVSYLIIWLHAGWRWGGPLTTWLMIAFSIVWITGIFGVLVQNIVPRLMLDRLPKETVFSQIGQVGLKNLQAAQQLVDDWIEKNDPDALKPAVNRSSAGTVLREFYQSQVGPFLMSGVDSGPQSFINPTSALQFPTALKSVKPIKLAPQREAFAGLRNRFLALFEPLAQLETLVCEHEEHLLQRKLHWLLHGWLLVHVPLSIVMFVMIPVHAFYALRY